MRELSLQASNSFGIHGLLFLSPLALLDGMRSVIHFMSVFLEVQPQGIDVTMIYHFKAG